MKLTNLETYFFILAHLPEQDIETLCAFHSKERSSVSVLKYLSEQSKILNSCNAKKYICRNDFLSFATQS